jgi:hypothetical protein
MRGIAWLAEDLLASKKGLFSMGLCRQLNRRFLHKSGNTIRIGTELLYVNFLRFCKFLYSITYTYGGTLPSKFFKFGFLTCSPKQIH